MLKASSVQATSLNPQETFVLAEMCASCAKGLLSAGTSLKPQETFVPAEMCASCAKGLLSAGDLFEPSGNLCSS